MATFVKDKMMKILMIGRIKWLKSNEYFLALVISFVLVSSFESVVLNHNTVFLKLVQNTFLGLNLFLEILIFLPLIS